MIILLPIAIGLLVQLIKTIVRWVTSGFDLKTYFRYGGMPSSHAAFVTSAAMLAGLMEGWNSAIFMIALVFAIVVIRDAVGLRMYVSRQAEVWVKEQKIDRASDEADRLGITAGHRIPEVLIGGVLGIFLTWIGWIWFM